MQLKELEIAKSPAIGYRVSEPGEASVTDSHITKESHWGTNQSKASGWLSREAV